MRTESTLPCLLWLLLASPLTAQVPFEHVILDPRGSAPAKPYGKAIGDLSGDGRGDAFAASADGDGLHWYEFPTWSKRTIRATGTWSEDVQLADLDGDGDLDAVCGNKHGVYYYRNPLPDGDPRIDRWHAIRVGSDGTNVHDLEVGDLDGDGRQDVAIRYEKENRRSVRVYLQQSPTSFIEIATVNTTNLRAEGLGLGDLDHDGDLDIALGNIWCENRRRGTEWSEHRYASGLPDQLVVRVGDVNNDGRNEIVVCPQSSAVGPLAWFRYRDEQGRWEQHDIAPAVKRMHGLGLADFNQDGKLDIHTSFRHDLPGTQDKVSIWLSDGERTPSFAEQVLATSGSHFSKVGDIGGDGDWDIVGANWSTAAPNGAPIELWENKIADH